MPDRIRTQDEKERRKALGKILRAGRRARNLTRAEMARATRYSVWTITHVEEGGWDIEYDLVKGYAEVFGLEANDLYNQAGELYERNRAASGTL